MNAGAGINPVVGLSDCDSTTHFVRTTAVADREDFANAGVPRPPEDSFAVVVEAGIVEVRVRVNQHMKSYPLADGEGNHFRRAPFSTSSWKPASTGRSSVPIEAATIMPFDSRPRNFLGWRFATITTFLPISDAGL